MIEVVGHTAVDHICKVTHLPAPNASSHIKDRKIYFGGGAANIAAGIAVLDEKAALISAVGGDFAGSDYDFWMKKLGIEQKFFTVQDAHTATAFMFTDEAGDQMTFFEWGASLVFEKSEPPKLSFVHMATADPLFNVKVAEKAPFSSFDPGQDIHRYTKEHLTTILDNIDILFANHHEVAGMCKTLGITKQELKDSVPMTIMTMSEKGSEIHYNGKCTTIPSVKVKLADPTGAGDAYRAGFLSGYVKGYEPAECCKFGTVTASFIVSVIGCQTGLADWEMMKQRYNQNFGTFPEPVSDPIRV